MFGRLKQRVKEKTGRAKATALPDDVVSCIEFYKGMEARTKTLHSALNELNNVYDVNKRNELNLILNNLGHANSSTKTSAFCDSLTKKASAESTAMSTVAAEIEKFNGYLKNECKSHSSMISAINKARLDMDAATDRYGSKETDANRIKSEQTTRDYEAACNRIKENAKTIVDDEANHAKWLENITSGLKAIYN